MRLGAAMGRSGPAEPTGRLPAAALAAPGDPPGGAKPARDDFVALDAQIRSLKAQRASIWAATLPTLEAYGSWSGTDQDNLVDSDWIEGGARLTWVPVAAGARTARAAAARHRLAQARAERDRLAIGVDLEIRDAEASEAIARAEIDVRTRAVEMATASRDLVAARYASGLAPLTDLLAVEAALRSQQTRLRVAQIETIRATLRRQVAAGRSPALVGG